ncbi:MAG: hypothetical protein ACRD0U_05415 [Acidimicrobiales bacterium]
MESDDQSRERKERVIHTRIPSGLEEDLKRLADALRMPVSNLVRNILHDAMVAVDRIGQTVEDLVGDVSSHVGNETDQLRRRWARYEAGHRVVTELPGAAAQPATDPLEAVYGFQPVVLNIAASCAACGRALARGVAAHVGLTDRPGRRLFVCDNCVPRAGKND